MGVARLRRLRVLMTTRAGAVSARNAATGPVLDSTASTGLAALADGPPAHCGYFRFSRSIAMRALRALADHPDGAAQPYPTHTFGQSSS